MKHHRAIRGLRREDLAGIRAIVDETGLFPPEMLSEMAEPLLSGKPPYFWIVALRGDQAMGFAHYAPVIRTLVAPR